MKSFLILMILIGCTVNSFASEVLVSSVYPASVYSVATLDHWLKTYFTYQSEKVDYWKSPKETVRDRGGDCEDFAILVSYVLDDLKIENHIICITFKGQKTGHAICVFKKADGKWYAFSNTNLNDYPFDTIKQMLDFQQWDWENAYFTTRQHKYYEFLHNEEKE